MVNSILNFSNGSLDSILIEKEWVSFGHRFGVRLGHGESDVFGVFFSFGSQMIGKFSRTFPDICAVDGCCFSTATAVSELVRVQRSLLDWNFRSSNPRIPFLSETHLPSNMHADSERFC